MDVKIAADYRGDYPLLGCFEHLSGRIASRASGVKQLHGRISPFFSWRTAMKTLLLIAAALTSVANAGEWTFTTRVNPLTDGVSCTLMSASKRDVQVIFLGPSISFFTKHRLPFNEETTISSRVDKQEHEEIVLDVLRKTPNIAFTDDARADIYREKFKTGKTVYVRAETATGFDEARIPLDNFKEKAALFEKCIEKNQ